MLPTVKRPTRITHKSATVIDNIYVKSQRYENIASRVILSDISDHFPIIACMSEKDKSVKRVPLVFSHRPIDTTKLGKLAEALTRTGWVNILAGESVSECFDAVIQHFNVLMDEYHIPVMRTEISYRSIVREPWMTHGLMKSSRKRDLLYRKTVGKSRDSISCERYLRYRNMYNSIKKTCQACIL